MITDSPHLYRQEGLRQGVSSEVLSNALDRAQQIEQRGLQSILTLGHLAHITGVEHKKLRRIVKREVDPYRSFEIRRRIGRTPRLISVPKPLLMQVQRWILANCLDHLSPHPASHAYFPGNSIGLCAQRHLGARWLVKLDLHNFFHTITEDRVFRVFHGAGYSRLVSLELSRLCTRYGKSLNPDLRVRYRAAARSYSAIPDYSCDYLGFLPQGSPTSGALANHVAFSLDQSLQRLAESEGLVYTRYADDLTFSALEYDRKRAASLITKVGAIAKRLEFEIHKGKTRVAPPGARKIVLGLLVDGHEVRLRKETRGNILSHLRGVEQFGLVDHRRHRGFSSSFGFIRHVEGLLAFARGIEPLWGDEIHLRWKAVLRNGGIDYPELRNIWADDVLVNWIISDEPRP